MQKALSAIRNLRRKLLEKLISKEKKEILGSLLGAMRKAKKSTEEGK